MTAAVTFSWATVLLAACAGVTGDGANRENAGRRAAASESVELPRIPDRRCSLAEHGVKADGVANDSAAINKAIAACHAAGGGTLSFPAGTYLAGSVRLQSKVRLVLEAGATLKAAAEGFEPPEPNPYDKYQDFGHSHFRNALLWGEDISDVAIEGPGTIDGAALKTGDAPSGMGDKQISIKRGSRLLFRNLTQNFGGHFFYLLTDCEHLTMAGLQMNKGRDGIDLVGCRKVDLSDLRILGCGDDTIALKSDYSTGKRLLTEDVRVRDSVVESGCNGLQFGSETAGDFRRVRFSRIQVLRSGKAGIGIQTNDGGTIEDVVFEDITIKRAANPIFINTTKRLRTPEKVGPGRVRNIVIRNVTVTEVVQTNGREPPNAATISGLPEAPHENIVLENVTITYPGGGKAELAEVNPPYPSEYNPRMLGPRPAYGFYVRHVRGLVFRNVKVGFENADPRPAIAVKDVTGLTLDKVTAARAPEGALPSLRLKEVRDLTIRDSTPLPALRQASLTDGSY
jgi:polygalacturonase